MWPVARHGWRIGSGARLRLSGCGLFARPDHWSTLILPVQPVLNPVLVAGVLEGMDASGARLLRMRQGIWASSALPASSSASVCANWTPLSVSTVWIWYGTDLTKVWRKAAATRRVAFSCSLGKCELACPVDGYEQVQLALSGADFRDGELGLVGWIGFEALIVRSFGVGERPAGDGVALRAAVQAGAGQARGCWAEGRRSNR